MRMPWHKSKDLQLDLLDAEPEADADVRDRLADGDLHADAAARLQVAIPPAASEPGIPDGRPMLVAVSFLYEDGNNPRTEFPEAALQELAADICRRRSKFDPPRRSNIDPGMDADQVMAGCGQV